jgi:hypothetical protein
MDDCHFGYKQKLIKKTLGQINFCAKNLHAKSLSEAMPRQSTGLTLGFGGPKAKGSSAA